MRRPIIVTFIRALASVMLPEAINCSLLLAEWGFVWVLRDYFLMQAM